MSVPVSKRNESRFEAQHHFINLRNEITRLMLNDFGYSEEKYEKQIEKYKETHAKDPKCDEVVARWTKKCESFNRWFIDQECEAVLSIMRAIESEFTFGNSIYPSDTPAKIQEFCERRKHIDNAIAQCYVLKQELNYIIRTLPVDLNKFARFAKAIDRQVALYKGVRTADNRLIKKKQDK